ncbi:hypothetical protein [Ramlibacter humi]|uniref:Uncharacterized protein n=1 Tax=Ramlibacter humi TaxID=2530451 RepID=A0A4Z0BE47_9BURK|nr:hypothetical protein [Ramlibacter humi]TFY96597.1 hypothetical protein EZ216_20300 [Ramlibacter humi]
MTNKLSGFVAAILGGEPPSESLERAPHSQPDSGGGEDFPFERHVEVELRFSSTVRPPAGRDTFHGLFALDDSRYSVRVQSAGGQSFRAPAEFLIPSRAVPAFRPGTRFKVVSGTGVSGTGEVKAVYGASRY